MVVFQWAKSDAAVKMMGRGLGGNQGAVLPWCDIDCLFYWESVWWGGNHLVSKPHLPSKSASSCQVEKAMLRKTKSCCKCTSLFQVSGAFPSNIFFCVRENLPKKLTQLTHCLNHPQQEGEMEWMICSYYLLASRLDGKIWWVLAQHGSVPENLWFSSLYHCPKTVLHNSLPLMS